MNTKKSRPNFPKRAVITAGMPYGNKNLHFGHIGGLFVHADVYARFLRDRIGSDNVIFVSGTDCYGSPILASYHHLVNTSNYNGSIEDYVLGHYLHQKETLKSYDISLDLYGTSAFGESGTIHKALSQEIFHKLYKGGYLRKSSSPQFYDTELKTYLNGRQVIGKCPIKGCQSEKAYADECSLGHQYMPSDLLEPLSTLSKAKPLLKEVTNWYFDLEEAQHFISEHISHLKVEGTTRTFILRTIDEFLKDPTIYVKRKDVSDWDALLIRLPECHVMDNHKKPSLSLAFEHLEARDAARDILDSEGLHYRTGKTLVPFRLSGNSPWGVSFPDEENLSDLTFWVWPESLWAPISFTKTYLENTHGSSETWRDWWFNKETAVYQFIGEDNIYFYGVAETGLFSALLDIDNPYENTSSHELIPHLVANNHLLYMNKKASSSSTAKPPTAKELLSHYTAEQLRMHFLSLGLAKKSVSFCPGAYTDAQENKGPDPVLKDGNLLTNVFNRLLRSCFYTSQKYNGGKIPFGDVSPQILDLMSDGILKYERHMANHNFHSVTYVLDDLIRRMNKYWVHHMKKADQDDNEILRYQTLLDAFYSVKVILTLLHPIVPRGCEKVRHYLHVDESIWDWSYIFHPFESLIEDTHRHCLREIKPRFDFFERHPSQL